MWRALDKELRAHCYGLHRTRSLVSSKIGSEGANALGQALQTNKRLELLE